MPTKPDFMWEGPGLSLFNKSAVYDSSATFPATGICGDPRSYPVSSHFTRAGSFKSWIKYQPGRANTPPWDVAILSSALFSN